VLKYNQYLPGSRHNFILKLALEIRKKGIPEVTALFLIQQDYDLDINEIFKIVKDVYRFDLTREISTFPETQDIASLQKTSTSPTLTVETQDIASLHQKTISSTVETQYLASPPKVEKTPTKTNKPIDPDEEEIIFPLMDELDEIYYTGGRANPSR
jgi:hypothetical protein